MLSLTIDAGNSQVKAVLFEAERVLCHWRFRNDEDWMTHLMDALDSQRPEAVGAASVRDAESDIQTLAERICAHPAYLVSHQSPLPFAMTYATPQTLGPDRLAAAVGAWARFGGKGRPVVTMALGTAFTSEVVDAEGRFLGGSIAPGPLLQLEVLNRGTARLPLIEPVPDPSVIGDSTANSIRSGVWYAAVDSVAGRIARYEAELGVLPQVVLTGGWAGAVSARLDTPHVVDSHLIHRGILKVMQDARCV